MEEVTQPSSNAHHRFIHIGSYSDIFKFPSSDSESPQKMGLGTSWMKSIGGGHPTPSSCSNTILGIAGATGRISSRDHDIQNPLEKLILKQVKSSKSIFGPISLSPIGCLLWVNQAPHHVGNTRFGISSKRHFQWYIKLPFWATFYHWWESPPYTL